MAVYGHGTPPFSEKKSCNPVDPYGIAKTACEADIQVAGVQHGLDWCIIRPHNVYGVKQNIWDVYRNVLGIWMYNVLHDKPITIYGDGSQTRAFTYVDDILPCLWKAGTENNCSKEIINLGGITKTTILEAAETLTEVVKKSSKYPEIVFLPPRFEVKHAYCTWQKSVDLLGFKHLTSLEEGLSRMWDWAQQQPDRKRFVWPSYEISKGIYPYWKQAELKD
jgi:UDP-glucose 4-epimerase